MYKFEEARIPATKNFISHLYQIIKLNIKKSKLFYNLNIVPEKLNRTKEFY